MLNFSPEDRKSMFLLNVGIYLDYEEKNTTVTFTIVRKSNLIILNLRVYTRICLEGFSKSMQDLRQDSQFPG
jgi:hypothetical protein